MLISLVAGFPKSSSDFLLLVHRIQQHTKKAAEPVIVIDRLGTGLATSFVAIAHGISQIDVSRIEYEQATIDIATE